MSKSELYNVFHRHGQRRVLVGHACQRQPNGEASPWFAQTERVAYCTPGMRHCRRSSPLNRKAIEPGPDSSEDKLLELLACLNHFSQDTTSCFGLGKPVDLKSDSSSATSREIHTNISAAIGQLHQDALSLKLVLDDLGCGGVAADEGGFG